MNTYQFLSYLHSLDVKLTIDKNRLKCKGPKEVLTPQIQAQIAEYKTEILTFLHQDTDKITRITAESESIPLSFAQERLWFLNQLEGGSATYNMPAALRLTGDLNLDALHQALAEIVRRHEALRTSFPTVNGTPIQVIHPTDTINLEVIDLQYLADSKRELVLEQHIHRWSLTPFDLEIAPLIRCGLLQLSGTDYVFCINMHHIISDEWSTGIFVQELSALYPAFCNGNPSPLPELAIQYADFAVWQRQWLQGETLERQLSYWQQQLQGAPELLQLPTDRPRPSVQTYRGATHSFSLSTELTQSLQALSRQTGSTLYMTLLAAFATLLYRYTGESDVVIGSSIANRNRSEIEPLIGFFVNTLVLRTRLEEQLSFEQLLTQVRATTLTAYEHQDVPFEQVVEALQPQRSLSHSPLFQVLFELQNTPMGEIELPGVKLSELNAASTVAKFDLNLSMSETPLGLDCDWEYNTDLFDGSTIERMARHFENLLSAIIENPHQAVSELPLLSAVERQQLLIKWNDTQTSDPLDQCFPQLFEAQVARTPEAIAVVCGDQQLTYQELNLRANRWAHQLVARGVESETLIALLCDRNIDFLTAMLAVFKAGGAYLPLNPDHPAERIRQVIEQSQVALVLTASGYRTQISSSAQILLLEHLDQAECSSGNLSVNCTPHNLAYVIYTSGSTGTPKGAMLEHRGMLNHLYAKVRDLQLTAADIVAQTANQTFDISIWQFLVALMVGGRVEIISQEMAADPVQLRSLVERQQISILEIVPSLLRAILQQIPHLTTQNPVHLGNGTANSSVRAIGLEEQLESLRWLMLTGEALSPQLCRQWFEICPTIPMMNAYGPTECSDDVTHYPLAAPPAVEVLNLSIGRPVANTQLYILDPRLQPLPIGVTGELYVGGVGVGRGYLNHPQLTQVTFIPDPFSSDKSARLYKTGDLVRYLSDGNIEFLGRIDHQVKIRGFRIELGEIEAVLSHHLQIQQAVVISTEDSAGNQRLVAYVVSEAETLTHQQLREFLAQQLPAYMVPSAFVILDSLPLTPNGKVDRQALPAPAGEIEREHEYVAPQTPNQEIIANIFAAVLEIEKVGIHDNFFEIGGHSLLATQLISRLKQSFAVEIPLRAIFESPTIGKLDRTINQLRTDGQGLNLPNIERIAPETEDIPLSFAQERLWFLNQLEGASATYNMPAALLLTGDLNLDALHQALAEIVRRHESLRTSFATVNDIPIQVIHPTDTINLEVIDLQDLADSQRELVLEQHIHRWALTPFDLEIAPLIRCGLLQLSGTDYVFCLNMHHIVSDGWSIGVFVQELSALYSAFCAGAPSPLAKLEIQYADFALWQRQWLSGDVLEQKIQYWVGQLQGAPELLQLPTDRPRPSVQTYRGATESFSLSAELTQSLQALSQQTGSTLYMTLLAAFATLLYRYTGESDVVIGSPIANRNRSEIESLIGFFVNTLVLRTRLEERLSFEQLLKQVRETTLTAYEHQDVPFEQIVEALQPQRSMSHSPLFQVMFVLQNVPLGEIELPGVKLSELNAHSTIAKFDLTLSMSETPLGLECDWEYNTDLFDGSTIERMASHFENLLAVIVENPRQTVSELSLLSESERQQLLFDWNNTQTDYPQDKCIHQLFEEQVAKTPDAIAVVFEQQELTYQQLNQGANQLAHHLQTLGVKPEVLVGICVERSLKMVVGLLGILKAGGAYVPLDPSYPTERLSYMLSDAGIEVLLTQNNLLSILPSHSAQVVCVDTDGGAIESHSQDNLVTGVNAQNLAYVIYTSGSTGQPKGISIEHHSLCNLTRAQKQLFDLNLTSRVLQFASISFDASVWEIFMAVTSGASLIIGTAAALMPGDDLLQIIDRNLVTLVTLPPSALSVLSTDELPSLDRIIVAGEACPLDLAHQWSVNRCFFNAYGPSESTVCATVASISEGSENMPIGRPIANTQVYVLDRQMQPVPIGVTGELHIGGDGLARGYLNRPELTQAKFVPNPFSPDRSARLYKTGDLARYQPDGNIEFLGRLDHQVKIRGFRIELGEIEAVLSSHPQVQQAVAIATTDPTGNNRLIAYVVVSEKEHLSTQQLREFLQQQLPAYMVPSAFVILDTIPLTPNGKVDRKALPAPDGDIERTQEYAAPRTPNEEIIAHIFTTVLGVETVGIHDNFFELGGHSLVATQLTSRLKQSFAVDIPLRAVFEAPTVAQLDRTINQLRTQEQGWSLPAITRIAPNSESIPLSFAQERLWFLNQLEGASATYNMPAALRLTGELNLDAFDRSLAEIIRRHEALRTSFPTVNGTPMQVIHPSASMTIETIDLQHLPDNERKLELEQHIQQSALTPFDLEIAPLIRCSLLQLAETDYVFCINMHHIVSDGWSIGVLVQELSALYPAYCAGNPSPLKELEIQYADFALWQRQWLSGAVLEQQLEYWGSQLQGAPELLQLPTDRPRPSVQTYQGTTQSFTLSPELTQQLQALSRQTGSTLFMTLMAAFVTLLYRYSGESDVVIGSPIANRNRSEIEPLIGFFVNTLVLRTRLEDDLSFEQLLTQVRATTLTAYEHQDLPFEQIVEALQPQRSMSHSPLFQVMFVLQNVPLGEIELPGVKLSELNANSTIAKFDLTLSMSETPMGLGCEWEYNTDLFDKSTIERMTSHFENLLAAIVENPQQPVSKLSLLSAVERQQLLLEWNDTQTDYPQDKCIHQLFEEQVAKTPDAIAVVFEQQELTYQQLNQRANQLAHHLQTLGVKPEVLVGICVERSLEMVVGLLGILKAGGAYVPLDPSYPPERLSYMLSDAGIEVLLTQDNLLTVLPSHAARVVCLDTDGGVIESHSPKNLVNDVSAENLAYVIYTSGSTGEPKGVCVAHRSVVRLVQNTNYAQFNAEQVFLQLAPITFDASTLELWGSLLHGSKLVIFPSQVPDLDLLVDVLYQHQITCLWLTAGLFHVMVDEYLDALSPVQQLLAGGDVLSVDHVQRFRQRYPNCRLIDGYGPTENTTFTCCYSIIGQTQDLQQTVPIGRPIANTQVYILDRQMQPVPIGVTGELHIGGDGLARGYLNRPELTQAKFVPNPFSPDRSARLYKTGDLARYLPDSNIEFLGRIDHQVKIRGFRIELGEIEAVLSNHPQIQQATAIATTDLAGNQRLVAYVVSEEETLSTQQLREFLHQQLPTYMVPSAFVILDTLPLTPNGKVDRKALPAPDGDIERTQEYVAPQTPNQEIIAQIFATVLGVEAVSIHDNFFELGGHSLLATQVISSLRQVFQIDLSVRKLFETPTVADLACYCDIIGQRQLADSSSNEYERINL